MPKLKISNATFWVIFKHCGIGRTFKQLSTLCHIQELYSMRPLSFEFSHCVQIRVRQQLCIGFASVFPQKSQRFVVSGHAIALTFGHFTLGHNWDNKGERKKVKIQIPVLPSIPWDTCGNKEGFYPISGQWTNLKTLKYIATGCPNKFGIC